MKKIINLFAVIVVISMATSFAQEKKCIDSVFYHKIFNSIKNKQKDSIAFSFNYIPSDFVLNNIKKMNFLNANEYEKLVSEIKNKK